MQSFERPEAIYAAADGRVLVATSLNLYVVEGATLTPPIPEAIGFDFPGTVTSMTELPDGTLALGSFQGITFWDGATLTTIARAVDAAGRLWAATDAGIAVQDGAGGWQTATVATSGLNDSRIVALAVSGAPALLEPSAPARTGGLSGRVALVVTVSIGAAWQHAFAARTLASLADINPMPNPGLGGAPREFIVLGERFFSAPLHAQPALSRG